jgi:rare lipoprotein A
MKARFTMVMGLLCLASMGAAHARQPVNARWQGANAIQPAPPHGQRKLNRKGLSGKASYYANRFHGRKTASGHPYFKGAMTAAHRSLPLGTWVRVVNESNGNYVVVQITDRGPFARNRVIDLSRAAAVDLDMLEKGTAPVSLEVIQEFPPTWNAEQFHDLRLASGY